MDRSINIRLDVPMIGKYLIIKDRSIVAGNFIFESKDGEIQIGKDCFIGGSTFISHSRITIDNYVTIAPNSIVVKDIEDNTVVGGIPCRNFK